MAVKIDLDVCLKCYACLSTCPNSAISETDNGPSVDASKCKECGDCISVCPSSAISK